MKNFFYACFGFSLLIMHLFYCLILMIIFRDKNKCRSKYEYWQNPITLFKR